MTDKTNRAIAAYRKLVVRQYDVDELEQEVNRVVAGLGSDEFSRYAEATTAIDTAGNEVLETATRSRATNRTHFRQAVNRAGTDRDKVRSY